MLALYGSGRQAEALHVYQATRRALVDELGIEPSQELQRLERQILNQDSELAAAERRFAGTEPGGGAGELAASADVARRPRARDPGGHGAAPAAGGPARHVDRHRRDGQDAARHSRSLPSFLDEFADGVWFVGLAPLQDPDLVLTTAARVLGVLATSGETLAEDLGRHLRGRELLLVLDNFEHVLAAAPSIADIVAAAPT